MDLLDNTQREAIRAAMQNVIDTFMKTPVTYHLMGESLDRFNEDRQDQVSTDFLFAALVEYEFDDQDKIQESQAGALDRADVKITMGLRDLKALNFVDSNNLHIGKVEQDYFTTNGQVYKTTLIIYDGPLTQENVLLSVYGKRQEHKT